MVQLRCEWVDDGQASPRSGFDLGHMTFVSGDSSYSSRGRTPDQAMMLALAVADLLHGLQQLLLERRREFHFVGADSSFSVRFRRKGEQIVLQCGALHFAPIEGVLLCRAVLRDVEAFFQRPESRLPEADAALEDLKNSLSAFAQAFR